MTQQPAGAGPGAPFGSVPDRAAIAPTDPAGSGLQSGAARVLVLVAAALGMLIYLLGFVGEVSVTSSFGGPLLVSGGLLAGCAVVPRVGRVLAPAAVVTVTGTLLLLQMATGIGGPTVVIVATVLAFLESAAVVGALLAEAGVVTAHPGRPPAAVYPPGYPPGSAAAGFVPSGFRTGEYGRPTGYGPHAGLPAAIGAAPPAEPGRPGGGPPTPAGAGQAPDPGSSSADQQASGPPGHDPGRDAWHPAPGQADPTAAFAPPRPADPTRPDPAAPHHGGRPPGPLRPEEAEQTQIIKPDRP